MEGMTRRRTERNIHKSMEDGKTNKNKKKRRRKTRNGDKKKGKGKSLNRKY